jgi:hypothetical protein
MKRALFIAFLLTGLAAAQTVVITDTAPPGVATSATHQFACSNCPSVNWSVTGTGIFASTPGTINSSTGLYAAPSTVTAPNQSAGWQLGPINNALNVPINSLSVHAQSGYWMSRIANDCNTTRGCSFQYHRPILPQPGTAGFYDNIVNNFTPEQPTHFYYNGSNFDNTNFKQPLPPNVYMEEGWSLNNWSWAGEADQHLFSINKDTGEDQERYKYFPGYSFYAFTTGNPTLITVGTNVIRELQSPLNLWVSGATHCTSINANWRATVISPTQFSIPFNSTGCDLTGAKPHTYAYVCRDNTVNCNSVSGAKFPAASNWLGSGTDAAGLPISRLGVHIQEWWNRVANNILDPACNCVTLGHAIRTTLDNLAIAPADLYPSQSGHNVTGGHPQITPQTITRGVITTIVLPPNGSQSYFSTFLPCIDTVGHQWTSCVVGNTFQVVFLNGSGSCSTLNGQHVTATVSGAGLNSTFTVPVDSSGWSSCTGLEFYFDWIPYGARFRLKASFDNTTVCNTSSTTCKLEQAYLNTLKVYGMVLTDGTSPGDNWDVAFISDEFFPDETVNAVNNLRTSTALGYNPSWPTGGGFEQYFDIVDTTVLQVYTCNYGDSGCTDKNSYEGTTNTNRVTVTATAAGHGSASLDVNLLGTTVGCEKSRIAIPANGGTWQSSCFVTGNATTGLSYTLSPSISGATVSAGGLVMAPNSLSPNLTTRTTMKACSAADTSQCAYVDIFFLPVSPDGNIRLWFGGEDQTYTDFTGNTWFGQATTRGWDSRYEDPGVGFAQLLGTWHSNSANWIANLVTDPKLYGQSTSSNNDTNITIALANGSYTMKLYGEPGFGVNQSVSSGCVGSYPCAINVYDVEINGTVAASYQDGLSLAGGLYKGYQSSYSATVSNGVLQFNGRIREKDSSGHGMSMSSLLITPVASGTVTVTTTSLPTGTTGVSYSATLAATGGTPPYTWTYGGVFPPGITPHSDGTLDGTPTAAGTYSGLMVTATDSLGTMSAPKNLTIIISPAAIVITGTFDDGTIGVAYSSTLTASGGTAPYTWNVVNCIGACDLNNVPGLVFGAASSTTATEQGTPTLPGTFALSIQACDAFLVCSSPHAYPLFIGSLPAPTTINGVAVNGSTMN